jgi:phosphoenolpyruvate phosphomutase
MNKVEGLKTVFRSSKMEFLPGVYDEQSAALAEHEGFKGVWISVAEQVPCINSELAWRNVLKRVGALCGMLTIPTLLDIGRGYGDLVITVQQLRRLGVAGVCIEDGAESDLPWASDTINENCRQIRAAKAAAGNDILLIARCGALASGKGMQAALDRCDALQKAGVDAVLLHSQKAHGLEIAEFMYRWRHNVPVIIVSSQYSSVPLQVFDNAGVSVVIRATKTLDAGYGGAQTSDWLHADGGFGQNFPAMERLAAHSLR